MIDTIAELIKSKKPLTWLFYGDSITNGALHTFGWRDYTELFAERIRYELARTMDVVVKTAISGNTSEHLLESFDWRVKRFKPDVVFLMIGMNDCSKNSNVSLKAFISNIEELIKKIQDLNSKIVMQTTCPVLADTNRKERLSFDDYMQVIRDKAHENGLPLIDHTEYWQLRKEKDYLYMGNQIHPNEFGHRLFAELVFKQLGIYEPDSQTCKLNIP